MSEWLTYNERLVLIGSSLLGLTAGLVGCFAVLRKRSLLGDALGHAALPGLCLGFMIAGGRSMPALLAGALISGLVSVLFLAAILRWTRLREDVAIAIILSVFYGLGVVALSLLAKQSGSGQSGLESFLFGKTAGMIFDDVVWIAGLALGTIAILVLLWKELGLVTFDAEFARVQGWPVARIDMLIMFLMALAVVLGLPAVGALLVAALLILPAAAARFWTHRLGTMLSLSGAFGLCTGPRERSSAAKSPRLQPGL